MKKRFSVGVLLGLLFITMTACGRGSSSSTAKVEDTQKLEQEETTLLINAQENCEVFHAVDKIPNIVNDIDTLLWIVPRGGAGISDEGKSVLEKDNSIILESEGCLNQYQSSKNEDWYGNTDGKNLWIRVINVPYFPEEGVNELGHKDIMIYQEGKDAYFALQDPENLEMWTIWQLPDYGVWLEKEIDMYLRVTTGL